MFRIKFKNRLVVSFLVLELGLTKTVNEPQPQFSYSNLRYSSNKNSHVWQTKFVTTDHQWPKLEFHSHSVGVIFLLFFWFCWDSFQEENDKNVLLRFNLCMECTWKQPTLMSHFIPCLFLFSKFASRWGQCERLSFSHTFWAG